MKEITCIRDFGRMGVIAVAGEVRRVPDDLAVQLAATGCFVVTADAPESGEEAASPGEKATGKMKSREGR